ncbi:hypothetical protein AMS68_006263 [Peltaster fructicola]|uniref:Heterokaryon incompatibility domain-containing protein n=1 Tax=Peltaster fructicola TaxID=286661 RepID=A0A6H0Y1C9_9PEZI|nr:hypothetical protein AMS68_006263 [Peltaster fructicola]
MLEDCMALTRIASGSEIFRGRLVNCFSSRQIMADEKSTLSYEYERLPSIDHFRLLRLSPKRASQVLQISLHAFHHLDCPTYTAISYTWVPSTISAARWVWLDAICIDQSYAHERNQQVKLMATIYNNAQSVTAWLGQEDDSPVTRTSIERAFKYMSTGLRHAETLSELMQPMPSVSNSLMNAKVPSVPWSERRVFDQQVIDKAWDTDEERKHFGVFCAREYWKRKWTIQELVIPRVVTLQHGFSTLPMTTVEDFFHYWPSDVQQPVEKLAMHCFYNRKPRENPNSLYFHFPGSLRVLIATYIDNQCSEPIDHVYALANLASSRHLLPVDYSASGAQQLTDILRYLHEVEQLEPIDLLKWAAKLCRLVKPDVSQSQQIQHWFTLALPVAGKIDLQPESQWARACREMSLPIRSIEQLDCWNRAEASDAALRVLYHHELAWNRSVWTQPAHLKFFKLRHRYGHDEVYGLADSLEVDDIILIPGESRVALIIRGDPGWAQYWVGHALLFSGDAEQIGTLSPTYYYGSGTYGTHIPLATFRMSSMPLLEIATRLGELDAIRDL